MAAFGMEFGIRESIHHATPHVQAPSLIRCHGYSGRFIRSIVRSVTDLLHPPWRLDC
jgi:hypothetical protein